MNKKINTAALFGILFFSVPFTLFAAPSRDTLCEGIAEKGESERQQFENQKNIFESKKESRVDSLQATRAKLDADLTSQRNIAKIERDNVYRNILNKVTTPEERKAAEDFKVKVEAAVATREQAIDTARKNFRTSADLLRTKNNASREKALQSFQNITASALQNAKEECARKVPADEMRENYKENFERAKDSIEIDSIEKRKEALRTIGETENMAFRKAIGNYRTTVETLRQELKAVMSNSQTAQ